MREPANLGAGLAASLLFFITLFGLSCSGPEPSPAEFRDPRLPVERRVNDLIHRIRPDEELALIAGNRSGGIVSIQGNERLGIPTVEAVEGAMGISAKDKSGNPVPATAFPANIGMAATWNPDLAEKVGTVIAQQARSLGRGQIFGPLTDIGSSPLSGRVFETYGEDPWLTSRLANRFISGVQAEGEIATAIFRGGTPDQRVSREFALRPLEDAVTEAGVWAVMPRDARQFSGLGFLTEQLGFRGFAIHPGPPEGLSATTIDEQVRGILRAMFTSGIFDRHEKTSGSVETPAHRAVARAAASQSIVLLRNEGDLLPLDRNKVHSIAVFGPNAAVNRMAGGNYTVAARYSASPIEALRTAFGSHVVIAATSPSEAARADAAIVFVGTGATTEGETLDRTSLSLPAGQDELIEAVARANPHTVVVVIAGFPVAMGKWISAVPAVLDAWFPGEEGGNAIADVLSGAVNPSGRLPITFPARVEDIPVENSGLYPGYGHFDRESIQPLFPFGFGLSYTQFEYTDLAVLPSRVAPREFTEVSVTVRNTGARAGKETVQLYLHPLHSAASIERAVQDLRAFQQVELKPGEAQRVRLMLTGRATAYFDESSQDWVQDQAEFEVRVGSSSRDIRATGTLEITE